VYHFSKRTKKNSLALTISNYLSNVKNESY